MKVKKLLSLLLVGTIVAGTLMGCGGNTKEANEPAATNVVSEEETAVDSKEEYPNELTGKIVIATTRTDIADTKLKEIAEAFMDENPGTEVEFEGIKDYEQVVATRVAGGEAPDIYNILPNMGSDKYQEYFLPLDDLGFTENDLYFYHATKGADGNIYGFSDYVEYTGVVYNKKSFAEAGIEQVPQTMDEFYEACEKIKEAGMVPVGTAFKDVWTMFPWTDFGMVQVAANGDANGKNAYIEKDEIFDETEVKSMNVARELYHKGYFESDIMSANWDQFKIDIAQGKTAMHYTASWFPPQMVEQGTATEDVGMFPYPESKGIYCAPGKVMAVSKNSENPELAKAFLKYIIEDGKVANASGNAPAWKAAEVENPFIDELLSYHIPVIEIESTDPKFVEIYNEAEINEQSFLQSYVLEADDGKAQSLIDDVNAKWAAARANIMGN